MNENTPPPSRAWFNLAAILALIPAFITCFLTYKLFATYTLNRDGYMWSNGEVIATDFIQFAAVAEAWERGRIDEIYASLARQKEFMTLAAELKKPYEHTLSFNYPPFATWLLRPLAPLDYLHRFVGWTLIQFSFAVVALLCWRKELGPSLFGIVALAWFLSPPTMNNLILGHASFMALGIVSLTLLLLNRERDFLAGLVLSLLLYKPTLGVVLGPLLVVAGRWRVVAGVGVGAVLLYTASMAVSVKACRDYPNMGHELLTLATTYKDFFVRHFNWLGFAATILGKTPAEFTWIDRAIVLVPCVMLFLIVAKAWCIPWQPGTLRWNAGASAAVLATLVCTPYLYSYDTMLAGIAGVYSVKTWNARPEWHRWFILGCMFIAAYFVWGDEGLMENMQKAIGVRIQLAPIAFASWAVLEAMWAIKGVESCESRVASIA